MERTEFAETIDLMLDDVAAILHNQQVLARVHVALERNRISPFEQDFIYRDHFGEPPSEPRIFFIDGVRITSRVLHQTGIRLSDIQGADLLYEMEDEKFGLIQYKRATESIVPNDQVQLETLLRNCPEVCSNQRNRPIPMTWIPSKIFSFCGIWYAIIDGKDSRYVTACEAETIFDGQKTKDVKSFRSGLSKNAFMELFASCRIGALIGYPPKRVVRDHYVRQLVEMRHLILEMRQRGKWLER
jgi:hypothetical protein